MFHRNHAAIFFTAAASLIIAGCSFSQPDPGAPLYLERIIVEPYQRLTSTGINDARTEVVTDQATWVALWEEIWRNHSEAPELPAVDFSQEMVAFVSTGSQPSTGYYVELRAALETGGGVEIQGIAVSPAKNCGVGAAITNPVDIARMPRVEQPVKFAVQPSVHQCN
jgi:hypothetical protein